MAEHSSPTFFLALSVTIDWALWVLEGLCLLASMGFSKEQLHVSTHLLVLMPLPLQVTWSLCVPSGIWAQIRLPLGIGVSFGGSGGKGIFFLIYLFIYLFIYGCVGSLLLCAGFL